MTDKNNHNLYKDIFLGIGIVVLIVLAFLLGLKMGRKEFYYRYPPMFHPFFSDKRKAFVPNRFRGHGLVGTVESIGKESLVVKNRWGELVPVLVDKNTRYYSDGKEAKFSDIKKEKTVFIIGKPKENEVAVSAEVIRIF